MLPKIREIYQGTRKKNLPKTNLWASKNTTVPVSVPPKIKPDGWDSVLSGAQESS